MTLYDMVKNPNAYLGLGAGIYDGLSAYHGMGYNPDIDNATDPETAWNGGGLYPWSAFDTAGTITVSSNSVSESLSVVLDGLDSDYNPTKEIVTISGTTPVSTINSFIRLNRMTCMSNNIGVITANKGVTVGQVDAGQGMSMSGVYTVPAGHTAFLLCGDATVKKGSDAQIRFYARYYGMGFIVAHMAEVYQNTYRYDFPIPVMLPEKTDLDVRVFEVESSGTRVTCNFDLIVDNRLAY